MKTRHKAELEELIEKWVADLGKDADYEVWFGPLLVSCMACAAVAAFDAAVDSSAFATKQEYEDD